ncbi:hypothetical protein GALL_306720 [mine drainage metagenome]|uniref:Uncharacterized protein n=1 Tax=mine drainage metagenome TaxID=410659 RepID=A0A1J5QVZ0_9ZZZZ
MCFEALGIVEVVEEWPLEHTEPEYLHLQPSEALPNLRVALVPPRRRHVRNLAQSVHSRR